MPYVTRSEARKRTAQIAFTPQCNSQEWWNEYLQKVETLMRKEEEDQREACMKAFGIQLPPHVAKSFLAWIKEQEKQKPDDVTPSTVPLVKYEEAALDYHPDHLYHNLCSDTQLQGQLYAKDFLFDLTDWPKRCVFRPLFDTTSIREVLKKIQFQHLMPYSYRMCNPTGQVSITIKMQCTIAGVKKNIYMVAPHIGANEALAKYRPEDIINAVVDAMEYKMQHLPQHLEGLITGKILMVDIRQEQKPHSNGVLV